MNVPPTATAGDADRILLVDDDPTNLDILRNTLDGHGYKLMAATSGEDALRVALRARPSLVLLDVLMPGIDGYETCRRLKEDPATADAAVIFLSALEDAREKVRGLKAGAVDFVTKPFEPEEVLARVHTHLTVQRLQRQLAGRNAELQRELAVAQELLTEARRRVDGPASWGQPGRARVARVDREPRGDPRPPCPHGAARRGAGGCGPRDPPRLRTLASAVHTRELRPPRGRPKLGLNRGRGRAGSGGAATQPARSRGARHPLLEEIHRMPAALQQSLGAVLEAATRQRERGEPASPDVRVLASTSGPLSSEGGFHAALLARLEPRQLRVPALAERTEDIPTSPVSSWPSTPGGSERWSSGSLTSR